MPTIPILRLEDATPEQRAYCDAVMRRLGWDTVSTITRAMAMKVEIAAAHSKGMGMVMTGSDALPAWFREMLAVATSTIYACDY